MSLVTTRQRPKTQTRGEDTRRRILAAALDIFAAEGYEGASTRHLAERAGVNLPAIQYYFGSKEGLYRAVIGDIDGRREALIECRNQIAPIGMTAVEGDFSRGDVIAVRDPSGTEIARGLANYASAEARLLCRKPSSEFERLLGYTAEAEMVHRDNLVLTSH